VIQSGVIVASPHSGRDYPEDLLRRTILSDRAVRSSEDAYVDLLVAEAPTLGVPLLLATTPRAYVDLNRGADELDPALVEGVRRVVHNPRVTSGLGVIPRVVANGQPIYRGKMSLADAQERLSRCWTPYHEALRGLMDEQVATFGKAILLDCHSMPHEAIDELSQGGGRAPDVVLGDRYGSAADAEIVEFVEQAFVAEGLRVARNAPFAGAYITQQYGRPGDRRHVVQIELDRALYMDERRVEPNPDFAAVQALMTRVIGQVIQVGRSKRPLAAE
jgi:N-formylglutamate amidohydrolase